MEKGDEPGSFRSGVVAQDRLGREQQSVAATWNRSSRIESRLIVIVSPCRFTQAQPGWNACGSLHSSCESHDSPPLVAGAEPGCKRLSKLYRRIRAAERHIGRLHNVERVQVSTHASRSQSGFSLRIHFLALWVYITVQSAMRATR